MKETGIVRKLDSLGRIVLPSELRRNLKLGEHAPLEIYVEKDMIVLKKYTPSDIFTGEFEELVEYNGLRVSKSSIRHLAGLAGFEITEK